MLRKALCSLFMNSFPGFRERKPVNRQVTHALLGDVMIRGSSVVSQSLHKDVDRVFRPMNQNGQRTSQEIPDCLTSPGPGELADLHKVVATLSAKVSKLEKEIEEFGRQPLAGDDHDDL